MDRPVSKFIVTCVAGRAVKVDPSLPNLSTDFFQYMGVLQAGAMLEHNVYFWRRADEVTALGLLLLDFKDPDTFIAAVLGAIGGLPGFDPHESFTSSYRGNVLDQQLLDKIRIKTLYWLSSPPATPTRPFKDFRSYVASRLLVWRYANYLYRRLSRSESQSIEVLNPRLRCTALVS